MKFEKGQKVRVRQTEYEYVKACPSCARTAILKGSDGREYHFNDYEVSPVSDLAVGDRVQIGRDDRKATVREVGHYDPFEPDKTVGIQWDGWDGLCFYRPSDLTKLPPEEEWMVEEFKDSRGIGANIKRPGYCGHAVLYDDKTGWNNYGTIPSTVPESEWLKGVQLAAQVALRELAKQGKGTIREQCMAYPLIKEEEARQYAKRQAREKQLAELREPIVVGDFGEEVIVSVAAAKISRNNTSIGVRLTVNPHPGFYHFSAGEWDALYSRGKSALTRAAEIDRLEAEKDG